jgi:hypothetical protein
MKNKKAKNTVAVIVFSLLLICYVIPLTSELDILPRLSGSSYCYIPQTLYGFTHNTREVSGFVVDDKTGKFYEHEAELIFENRTGQDDELTFTFLLDVVEGFDESAVTFDAPNVSYSISEIKDGWRRLTILCKGVDTGQALTTKLIYPADALAVRNTAPGYYKWDIATLTEESIPELDKEIASFETPYACANWIKKNIEYLDHTSSPQTAADTVRLGKGDCDDVAVLFCYMMQKLYPETDSSIVEGWTLGGRYHANVAIHTDEGWLMLDPSVSSAKFGVFDFKPFVPAGRLSVPFLITDSEGNAMEAGGVGISFGRGEVAEVSR